MNTPKALSDVCSISRKVIDEKQLHARRNDPLTDGIIIKFPVRAQSRKSLGQWALKRAEYRELAAIFDISDELMALDDLTLVVSTAIDPESEPYQRVFWENEIDKGEPTREFVSGFVEGAMEVLEAVDAKISAVSWAALS